MARNWRKWPELMKCRISLQRLARLALLISCFSWTDCARADDFPSVQDSVPPLQLRPEPILQNWLDVPDWLSLSFGYVNEINGNPWGGLEQTATYTHNLSLNMTASSGLARSAEDWQEWDHWSLIANLSQRSGTSLSESIPNAQAVQQIFGYGQTFRLAGLWVERHQTESGLLKIKAGKVATFDDFASSPLFCFYSNNGFCGQIWGIPNSLPVAAYPANQYGAVAHLGKTDSTTLRYGIYQINPDAFEPGYHGADFQLNASRDGVAQFLQIDWPFSRTLALPVKQLDDGRVVRVPEDEKDLDFVSGLPAPGLQLGGWLGRWDFPQLEDPEQWSARNDGVYGLVSLPLTLGGLALDGRLWTTASYGFNPDVQTIPIFVAAGWVGKGVLRRRPHDALVLGVTHATWSSQAPGGQDWESILELGYQIALGDNASIQPNLQFILNPDGTSEVPDSIAIGVQMTVLF